MPRFSNEALNGDNLIGINPGNSLRGIPIDDITDIVDCDILQYNGETNHFGRFRAGLMSRLVTGVINIKNFKVLVVRNLVEADEDVNIIMDEDAEVLEL